MVTPVIHHHPFPFPLIIVEGPDNAGKSTLATTLAKQLRAMYVKCERKPRNSPDVLEYAAVLRQARQLMPVVSDRHPAISEQIYGPILRGDCYIKPYALKFMLTEFTHIIYCRPPRATTLQSIHDRPQMAGVPENINAICTAYDVFFDNQPGVLKYDFTTNTVDQIIGEMHGHD